MTHCCLTGVCQLLPADAEKCVRDFGVLLAAHLRPPRPRPEIIFVMDEVSMAWNPAKRRVIAPRGGRKVVFRVQGSEKECSSILLCGMMRLRWENGLPTATSATHCLTLVVMKGELKTKTGRNSFVAADIETFTQANCGAQNSARLFVTANERGWMTGHLFASHI